MMTGRETSTMRTDPWNAIFDARKKLSTYIDALWIGRLIAAPDLKEIYTERLAVAAKLSALLRGLRSTDEIRAIVRQENGQFPRDFLATDAGRGARAAFNLLGRAAAALEEHRAPDGSLATGPETIVGQQLSSVVFVMDYIQLDFHGQFFQVLCPFQIHAAGTIVRHGDDSFRDRLCEAIGQTVRSIEIGEDAVIITLERCRIDLLYGLGGTGLETLNFTNRDHVFQVFNRPK
jgi:hypothetical protein